MTIYKFAGYVYPICLPTQRIFKNERTLKGVLLEVAGWGVLSQGNTSLT